MSDDTFRLVGYIAICVLFAYITIMRLTDKSK